MITWRVEAGPEVSFLVHKKVTDDINPKIQTSDLNSANWYVLAGSGIDVLFLAIDIRYKWGLSNVVSDASNLAFDSKNNMFLVSVGFKIFGKK